MEIIKRGHVQEEFYRLKYAEEIELWLKQHKNINQFIIFENDNDNNIKEFKLEELFPKRVISYENFNTKMESEQSLDVINELFAIENIPINTPEILHKVTPSGLKTSDSYKDIDVDMLNVSIRVLNSTRRSFINSALQGDSNSPFKKQNRAITEHILNYADLSM
jgi:hypothetical protein